MRSTTEIWPTPVQAPHVRLQDMMEQKREKNITSIKRWSMTFGKKKKKEKKKSRAFAKKTKSYLTLTDSDIHQQVHYS